MKFYEIEIQTDMQDQESKGIYSYNTLEDAVIVYHQKVASGMTAIKNGTLKSALNVVINAKGEKLFADYKEKKKEEA